MCIAALISRKRFGDPSVVRESAESASDARLSAARTPLCSFGE